MNKMITNKNYQLDMINIKPKGIVKSGGKIRKIYQI